MEQKKLVEQLIKASNEISKNKKPSANYIHLSEEFIQQQADEREISFDDMIEIIKMENNKDKGYVWLPYITKTVRTDINGETVWYANKWKNLLLKVKHFFIKPKYLKNAHIYKNKMVNSSFYGV